MSYGGSSKQDSGIRGGKERVCEDPGTEQLTFPGNEDQTSKTKLLTPLFLPAKAQPGHLFPPPGKGLSPV